MSEKKKIEDYLHLYLGCELKVEGSDLMWKLTAVQSDSNLIVARNNIDSRQGQFFNLKKVKPILRPLSDMTRDEVLLLKPLMDPKNVFTDEDVNDALVTVKVARWKDLAFDDIDAATVLK